jgi:hypothetical protein
VCFGGRIADCERHRYEQLTIRAANLREELHTEVERILNDVIKFKIHIQQKLEDYETFVDQEVSQEYEMLAEGTTDNDEQQHSEPQGVEVGASEPEDRMEED